MGLMENFPPSLGCVPCSDWLKYGVTDFILNPLPSNLNRYSQTEREAPGVRLPPDPKAGRQIAHRISIHPFSIITIVIVGESACTQIACMVFGESAVTFLTLFALSGTRAGAFWESVAL